MREPTEDSLVIVNRRGRGRPPALQPSIRVSTWIPLTEYDRVLRKVKTQDDTSLSRFIREAIKKELAR